MFALLVLLSLLIQGSNGGGEGGICGTSHETYVINGSSVLGQYKSAAVAVDSGDCSTVGKEILQKNGTTVDAAIAAAICNGLINGHSMGIGGGCIMVIYSKKRNKVYSIVAREKAPFAANSTMFVGRANMSQYGPLAIGTPGEIAGYRKAWEEFGQGVAWRELFLPTIKLCRDGYLVTSSHAGAIQERRKEILNDPLLRAVFVKNLTTLELYGQGDKIKRPQLADTLQAIADNGSEAFYTGELSDKIVEEIKEKGGIITKEDLKNYTVHFDEALAVKLNDSLTAYTTHAPSSGPLLVFILNILQGYKVQPDESQRTDTNALFYHRLVEAFKFAYAARSELGDPFHVDVQQLIKNLTSESYATDIRKRINDDKTYSFEYYGGTWLDKYKQGTAHMSLVGPDGDAVGLTSTINLYFGSKVIGRLTGIIYNNEMDDFSTPNETNYFDVPASPANYIAPGKRPVSSMSPLIVLDHLQRPQLVMGASGGTKITTTLAQVAMQNLWFNHNIKEAIDAPRVHHQLLPQELLAEEGFDKVGHLFLVTIILLEIFHKVLALLRQRGHNITCVQFGGSV
ncbi:unnamed protein product, partial [Didymodactylos carnosus]